MRGIVFLLQTFFSKIVFKLICSWNQTARILEIKLRTSFSIFLSKKYLLVTLTIYLKMNILLMILDINKKRILPNISNNVGGKKITLCLAFTWFRVKVFFCLVCGTGFLCMLIVSWYFFFQKKSHHFSFLSSLPCIILIGGASERSYQMLFIMKLFSEITLFSRHNPNLASSWYHLGISKCYFGDFTKLLHGVSLLTSESNTEVSSSGFLDFW